MVVAFRARTDIVFSVKTQEKRGSMSPTDDHGKKPKNPWDRGDSQQGGGRNPWGGGGQGGEPPPELDELLRRARHNLSQVMPGGMKGGDMLAMGLAAIVFLWLASGFFIVTPGEHGVIQRFGAFNRPQTTEGWGYHLPWPVESVTKVSVSEVRQMPIGFIEQHGQGYTQRQSVPDESLMLTADRNIISIGFVVQWNIKSAEEYLFNIADPENTIKKVAESAIREVVGQTEMFAIITTNREEVAQRTRELMVKMLDEYKSGVNVSAVLIKEAIVHPDVHDAFQDVQSAKQDASNLENQAGVYKQGILPQAEGNASKIRQEAEAYKTAAINKAKGDADRFNEIYSAYQAAPDVTKKRMYIETMENVLENAQKIIVDSNTAKGGGVIPFMSLDNIKPSAGASDDSQNNR
jgi:modulator of FtsH protease HflK